MKQKLTILFLLISLTGFSQLRSIQDFGFYGSLGGEVGIHSNKKNDTVLFISLIGQSNIDGNALISGLTGDLAKYKSEINANIFDSINFLKLNATLNNNQFPARMQDNHFGPELSLAYTLDSLTDKNIYLVKYAIGGTYLYDYALAEDWNVWNPDELYYYWKTIRLGALAKLSGKVINEYIIWYQGEKDAGSSAASTVYSANLENFIDSVNVVTDSCKFYVVRIHRNTDSTSFPYHESIRTSQYNTFIKHKNVELVNVDDYVLSTDSTHLTVQSEINLGRKIAHRAYNYFNPSQEAKTLLAEFIGITPNLRMKIIDTYDSLNYYGFTDSLSVLYAFKTENVQFAKRNWINPSDTFTLINSPVFSVDSGYKCAVSGQRYINSNYNPNNDPKFELGFSCAGLYSNAGIGRGLYSDFGVQNGTSRIYLSINYLGNIYGQFNSLSTNIAATDTIGSFAVNISPISPTVSTVKVWKNGVVLDSDNRNLADLVEMDNEIYIGALNNGDVASQFSNRPYSYFFFGKFKNIPKFQTIMQQYMWGKLIF